LRIQSQREEHAAKQQIPLLAKAGVVLSEPRSAPIEAPIKDRFATIYRDHL